MKSSLVGALSTTLLFLLLSAVTNAQANNNNNIIACNPTTTLLCATSLNRTCYNYTLPTTTSYNNTHTCSTCLNGYIEYDFSCYSIDDLQDNAQYFTSVSKMIEVLTPEYADPTISTEERAYRLGNVSKVISYWESRVPPTQFNLRLNDESTLTLEERKMRLGVNNAIRFDLNEQVDLGRGKLEQFIVKGVNDDDDDDETIIDDGETELVEGGEVVATNPSRRLLLTATTTNTKKKKKKQYHRRLEDTPSAIDWHAAGYTTIVKNQGYCGCCWAVSTAAAVESALMITNKTNKFDAMTSNSLSFQQMVSCDEQNLACNGGNIVSAVSIACVSLLLCVL